MIDQDRLAAALAMAHAAHRTQRRKGTSIPYISHPMAVSALVFEYGGSEDQAIAALLHDTLEDGGRAYVARIAGAFGDAVRDMVLACSDGTAESKALARTADAKLADWRARKVAYLRHLRGIAPGDPALLVSACDKLHNVRSIIDDVRQLGPVVFERFTGRRDGTLWYYDELADVFAAKRVAPALALVRAVATLQAKAG